MMMLSKKSMCLADATVQLTPSVCTVGDVDLGACIPQVYTCMSVVHVQVIIVLVGLCLSRPPQIFVPQRR